MKFRDRARKRFYLAPEKKLIIKQVLLGILLFGLLGLLLTGVWHGTRVPSLTIQEIIVEDGETIQASVVKESVEQELAGDYWKLIPRRFAWFYPEDDILRKLKEIERIREVSISRNTGTKLSVTFSEYRPTALWCDKNEESCYFLDERGFAFGKAPLLTGKSLVRYTNSKEPQIKTNLLKEENFTKTRTFIDLLQDIDWYVDKIEVDTANDVFYILGSGSELRSSLEDDPVETFGYLKTLTNSNEFSHLKPGNFQYVDLRFGEKLYVNEGAEILETSTSSEETIDNEE